VSVDTDVDRARERVADEREWTTEKHRAFEDFADAVAEIDVATPGGTVAFGGPTAVATTNESRAGVSAVLDAFEEHLDPYSGDARESPDTVHEAVATEFSAELAVSLCGGDSAGMLTPQLKGVVQAETRSRIDELDVMGRALEREDVSLDSVDDAAGEICGWFVEHNPTPLPELGFDRLRDCHETIEGHRERLDAVAAERQDHLHATTGSSAAVGIDHRVLVEYLYAGFPVSYPALATLARLDDACKEAQRSLRAHLVARA
jgi:hypothetical protein